MKRKLPFARPSTNFLEILAVARAIRSGWMTTGRVCQRFEQEFKKKLNIGSAIAVNSATSGLHLAYEALGLCPGKFIITSPYTFTSTAEAARYLGGDVVFCDVDEDSFNISPSRLAELLEQLSQSGKIADLVAIVPVHIAGRACNMEKIIEISRKYNIPVVEDAAHAFPARYKESYLGALSDIGVYSFYATKTITTGEGGLVVTRDDEIARRIRLMRLHGIDRDVWGRFNNAGVNWEYDVVEAGYKYNLPDINASIGVVQFKKAEKFLQIRKKIAHRYYDLLSSCSEIILPEYSDYHSWHLFIIRVKDLEKFPRNQLIAFLSEKGIGTSVHYKPLHLMSYYKSRYQFSADSFPVATRIFSSAISLPIYPGLKFSEVKYVCDTIKEFFDKSNS
ncbi:MAG: DegT/DnrJ/EryC1/StrS family aminotransferase [Spirochaetales bacterium]|nr:DegT/DnrJ/EryC1/StrS family aminotransferase [Spirochaetales bacterium]